MIELKSTNRCIAWVVMKNKKIIIFRIFNQKSKKKKKEFFFLSWDISVLFLIFPQCLVLVLKFEKYNTKKWDNWLKEKIK